ncbi:peptide-methionine (R)-S-oxide reductase MsrB [Streptomyces mirabilis]|uniref:peptide-methionine (R)-S-oxide reductase MsrB n=1 Tax=Streptomyces TaxID=1883 RepID=UPI0029ADDFC2|nr:peptide-methionine (R)-S-oxide reductase MsrB [Streptomyces sp. AK02-04a]MDX3761901.1 peptide-methionine (R)-S-oxide reductase MsrB [Streptomyces sp. AK02-04a]
MAYDIDKSDAEWRAELTPAEYRVLRGARDEAPFTGEYTDTKVEGVYSCRACGAELFTSEEKFDSRCGWPSFYDPKDLDSVEVERHQPPFGQEAPVVRCARCGSYLGELFEGEGFATPTDKRYCINSLSLRLKPADSE